MPTSSKKPIIGITVVVQEINIFERQINCSLLPQQYLQATISAGGVPLLLTPLDDVRDYLDIVNGLIFCGGLDIAPALYNEATHAKTKVGCIERDLFEIKLMQEAMRLDIPILAICRGTQVLNVAMGGTLIQDIEEQVGQSIKHFQDKPEYISTHEVDLRDGKIIEIMGKEKIKVNSFHHQAIDKLGNGLLCRGVSSDNIIETVEAPEKFWVIGVQWHPELMINHFVEQQNLFKTLVNKSLEIMQ